MPSCPFARCIEATYLYLRVAEVVSDPAMKKSTSVFLRLSSARSGEKEEEGSSRARLR